MDFDPLLYDGKGGPYRSIFYAYHMGTAFLELCCTPAADSSFGFRGDYGDRIQLYCLNTVYFFCWGIVFIIYCLAPAEIQADATNQQF